MVRRGGGKLDGGKLDGGKLDGGGLGCFRGGRQVFEALDFTLAAGETLLVSGPNGSGKSTFLRLLAGLLRPSAGALRCDGRPVTDDLGAYQAQLAYVGHAEALKSLLTGRENLEFWQRPDGLPVAEALGALGLSALGELPAKLLSSGQRRRLALARLAVSGARLWLLDEPTVGLDTDARAALEALLARHGEAGGLTVVASHGAIELPRLRPLDMADFAVDHIPELVW